MNAKQDSGEASKSAAWAPYDYSDGRKEGDWQTNYPTKARNWIRVETAYLVLLLAGSLAGVFLVLSKTCGACPPPTSGGGTSGSPAPESLAFLGYLGAILAGTLGGCCFGVKCMYHFVSKRLWHEDRRLWRLLSPPISGVLSLFMVLLVASGLLQVFDASFIEHPIRVMAFSFVAGYFSDKALAKMAEVADTLFGASAKADPAQQR